MLSTPAKEIAVDPIKVKRNDTVGDVSKVLKPNVPVFIVEEKVGVIDPSVLRRVGKAEKVEKLAVWVDPVDGDEPLYRIAQVMIEREIHSVPIKTDEGIKGITYKIVLGALKATKELAKRNARTVMSSVPIVSERRIQNIENIANKNNVNIVPIVNSEKKLVAVWLDGKVNRRPSIVREGTRVKLVVDKVLSKPVVVINKQREPVGVITVDDLLDLAASYREFNVPIFYTGLEALSQLDREHVKGEVEKVMRRISKIVTPFYASVHIRKRGTWMVRIKLSTQLRMFSVSREGIELINVMREALENLEEQVRSEKEKRVEWKRLIRE